MKYSELRLQIESVPTLAQIQISSRLQLFWVKQLLYIYQMICNVYMVLYKLHECRMKTFLPHPSKKSWHPSTLSAVWITVGSIIEKTLFIQVLLRSVEGIENVQAIQANGSMTGNENWSWVNNDNAYDTCETGTAEYCRVLCSFPLDKPIILP